MHGGAAGSGAPLGNANRRTHGRYARATVGRRWALQALIRESNATMRAFAASSALAGSPQRRARSGAGGRPVAMADAGTEQAAPGRTKHEIPGTIRGPTRDQDR